MLSEKSICYRCIHQKVCSKFWNLIPDFEPTVDVELVRCDNFYPEED